MASLLTSALRFPGVVARHRDIVGAFVSRDLKARYEGSLLGRLWPVLQPALLLAVYSLVFTKMLSIPLKPVGATVPIGEGWITPFFMLSGILPWLCTVESVTRCTAVVVENGNLIKKVAFPSELLPTYSTVVGFVQMLIGFALFVPLYVVVVLVTTKDGGAGELLRHLAWFPVPVVLQFVFVAGLGMLLAALNVYVRDIGQAVPLATMIWMFLSPIFYRVEMIASATPAPPAWVITAMKCNPLYHLLAMYRAVFAYEAGTTFPLESLGIFAAIAVGTFLIGHGCFHLWKRGFPDEV
jgi:ABC-type polysaccharide/polyol phosphate export permease